ncbi:MAG TPA: tripartite tricarboxylate transporter permease [Bauldia sp.]|nr:tripartite tricarboxylate transporter permease [Bauldia sp.]
MDVIHGIVAGLSPDLLAYCFLGCLLGTLVGVLPGLGPAATMSILLPLTQTLNNPAGSIIMLAGLYYGAAYGGSTTSILTNIPGEVSSIPTCIDGFPMTKKGRAGEALWIAAVGSFIAGTFGVIMMSVIGPGFARFALEFGPPEYFGLLFFSLITLIALSGGSVTKGLALGLIGMALGTVGVDQISGSQFQFAFGSTQLMRGFDIVPLAVGLFGIGEVLASSEQGVAQIYSGAIGKMMPRGRELVNGLLACVRGTLVGFPLGLLPGMTPPVAAFLAYDLEKKISKYPEKFGTGVIEGVAAPESANNANAQAAFIPLFAFGIPTGPSPALILAAMLMYGLQPGPLMFINNSDFVYAIIGSMYIGNIMLLVLNLPLVGMWARLSKLPYKYLAPTIIGVCFIAAYSTRNSMFDVWVAVAAGIVGYIMRRRGWPLAPVILGFILGPIIELALSQSMNMGGVTIFAHRPIAAGLLLLTAVVIGATLWLRRGVIPTAALEEDAANM